MTNSEDKETKNETGEENVVEVKNADTSEKNKKKKDSQCCILF